MTNRENPTIYLFFSLPVSPHQWWTDPDFFPLLWVVFFVLFCFALSCSGVRVSCVWWQPLSCSLPLSSTCPVRPLRSDHLRFPPGTYPASSAASDPSSHAHHAPRWVPALLPYLHQTPSRSEEAVKHRESRQDRRAFVLSLSVLIQSQELSVRRAWGICFDYWILCRRLLPSLMFCFALV